MGHRQNLQIMMCFKFTVANSAELDGIWHFVAFDLLLYCLLNLKAPTKQHLKMLMYGSQMNVHEPKYSDTFYVKCISNI